MNMTGEMVDWFIKRTTAHIKKVKKYIDRYHGYANVPDVIAMESHDSSKFEEPELSPYIIITWDYYCKDRGIPFAIPSDIKEKMHEATLHHIKSNRHHPEYWIDRTDGLISKNDRDSVNVSTIQVEHMPRYALIEMCADWCAMSEERENTPFEWYEKVIGTRWNFGSNNSVIWKILERMWRDQI